MLLAPPSASELDAIRAAHAHRFPQTLDVALLGDGGAPVTAHLVIGNPSGCRLAPNQPPPLADPWRIFLASALRTKDEPSTFKADLCADIVLWPNPATEWPQLLARWPGITEPISKKLLAKIGAGGSMTQPAGGLSYTYAPTRSERRTFTIDPPDAMRWQVYIDCVRDERGDLWRTLSEMVAACVRMQDLDATIFRWPGFALRAFDLISTVAGASAEAELGE